MNVPVGKSTVAAWIVALGGFVAAILTSWQDAPSWVSVVLAGLGYLTVIVNGHDRSTQANTLVDAKSGTADAIGVAVDKPVFTDDDGTVGFN